MKVEEEKLQLLLCIIQGLVREDKQEIHNGRHFLKHIEKPATPENVQLN